METLGVLCLPFGFAIGAALGLYRSANAHIAEEVKYLRQAKTLLKDHQEAFEEFIDTDANLYLKEALYDFSRQIASKKSALEFVTEFTKHLVDPSFQKDAGRLATELTALQEKRPGQARLFKTAVSAGLIATLFRWQEARAIAERAVIRLATHADEEVADAVRVSEAVRRQPDRKLPDASLVAA